ncbi:carboxypeptidase regulatory-like domain-containing protein [Blastopirellula sp. J2-11]|uniref:carboxypeptidase regulatory-like domain-containing protein n=1 Tax=Blastopirellula sp. J2-11 TaxID=2943192 RepID=UPI0021C6925B|nr:carboxypeptidase regulatory-like domain-containing protein [Blastopirellula sp. J2-11]UUO04499.1 carboxypeptidase regulatory-like domain-containing protein [Blastopirellula sp. J2-11]
MNYSLICISLCSLLLSAIGCNFNSSEYGHVVGVIKINGAPVEDAVVIFSPVAGGRSAMAITKADGSYELNYTPGVKGAKLGENRVVLSTYVSPFRDDDGVSSLGEPERFPPEYSQGTEFVTIEPGENTFDFDIEADRDKYPTQ